MTDAATVNAQAPSTTQPTKRPPELRLPKAVQGVAFAGFRRWMLRKAFGRYGRVIVLNLPFFGRTVLVSDPALIRQVFMASTDDLINVQPNLSRIFGPGSVFALDRGGAPQPPQAARPAVPRPEHQELREDHRGRDPARKRQLA